jgi:type III pantothenate kinase
MMLLADLGNTRLKWAWAGPGTWQTGAAAHADAGRVLDDERARLPVIDRVVYCCVAGEAVRSQWLAWCRAQGIRQIDEMRALASGHGVRSRYDQPAQLGADRFAALVGAHHLYPARALCVIDAGSAVTLDVLRADGEYAGGVILPGLQLAREALWQRTQQIAPGASEATQCLARNTMDGVSAGTLIGLAGAIERIAAAQEQEAGEPLLPVLTGGDAAMLAPQLTRRHEHQPELVLKGLAVMAGATT